MTDIGMAEQLTWVTIARRYFVEQKTKIEIAKEMGISRFRVARILAACLEQGIVEVIIHAPTDVDADLSAALRDRYELTHAIVVAQSPATTEELRSMLGKTAARLLVETVEEGDVLGLTWGRTLNAMSPGLGPLRRCDVVQMTGVVGLQANSVELVRQFAAFSGGDAYPIYGPLVVDEDRTARSLRAQPMVALAMAQYDRITRAAIALGSWDPPDSQLWDVLAPTERLALRRRGVVAEVGSVLLAKDGSVVPSSLPGRCLSMSTEQLRRVPDVLVVAGGKTKATAVRAALRSGLVSAIVTDAVAARYALGPA